MPEWFHLRPPTQPEDPAVGPIEAILEASRRYEPVPDRPKAATHALWICACVTHDDAPTWLIHDDEGRLEWCRVPDGTEALDLVNARFTAGNHSDPADVLDWLLGRADIPWTWDEYSGDAAVLGALRGKLDSQ